MSLEREDRLTQIARFEQQLEELHQRYNKLELRRTRLQQQVERVTQQYNKLKMRIEKYQQQLEQLIALFKEQIENDR